MVRSANYQNQRQQEQQPDAFSTFAEMLGELLMKLCAGLLLLVWWAILFPILSVPVAAAVALGWWLGWPYGVAAAIVTLAWWVMFWAWLPAVWHRWVWGRMRSRYLTWTRYKRRWKTLTALHGLTTVLDTGVLTPHLFKVVIGDTADVLVVKLLDGQTVDDWAKKSDALRNALGALGVRVRKMESGWVRLQVIHTDRLAGPIPFPRVEPETVDLEALTIGLTELGEPWRIRLLGSGVLVAGVMGAGKGSVAWAAIAALGPAIRDGRVVLWVIDPKGGMEFGAARKWFARFAFDNGPGALALLRDAVELVQSRGNVYRERWERKIVPTVGEPMVLIIIDEAASLTAFYSDRKIKDEITRLLGVLLTQSRAVAMPVMACLQDPAKDTLEQRQYFSYRIGLRMTEPTQPNMLFGLSGRDRGALCDEIPESMPGIAYVEEEGSTEITRVRAFHVTDDDIRWIIRTYPPLPRRDSDTDA
ncbi:FtsK/SpoIIIE domain-containing protein [Nocardia terpenica]|uniref:Cell division protein FtsK n=1 Tax=Nocardia terpenica TaxID=455432 RepID=A0A291RN76_9NOCA|nr:cell division protein FtsK [Nocardia terpenica]ATL69061.1 cell division protein FtsK [Nocardia terpenica]